MTALIWKRSIEPAVTWLFDLIMYGFLPDLYSQVQYNVFIQSLNEKSTINHFTASATPSGIREKHVVLYLQPISNIII